MAPGMKYAPLKNPCPQPMFDVGVVGIGIAGLLQGRNEEEL